MLGSSRPRRWRSSATGRSGRATIRKRNSRVASLSGSRTGQHDVHAAHGGDLFNQLAGAVAQAFAAHPHLQGAPKGEAQKADQDVGFDPFGLLMKDGAQAQIALADAEGVFGLAKLDIPAPEFGGILLRAVGAQANTRRGRGRPRRCVRLRSVIFNPQARPFASRSTSTSSRRSAAG